MCLILASEIPYRLLGGDDDGPRPAAHWTCTETDGTYPTLPPILYAVDLTFVSPNL